MTIHPIVALRGTSKINIEHWTFGADTSASIHLRCSCWNSLAASGVEEQLGCVLASAALPRKGGVVVAFHIPDLEPTGMSARSPLKRRRTLRPTCHRGKCMYVRSTGITLHYITLGAGSAEGVMQQSLLSPV
jgi:hypothetical protein